MQNSSSNLQNHNNLDLKNQSSSTANVGAQANSGGNFMFTN